MIVIIVIIIIIVIIVLILSIGEVIVGAITIWAMAVTARPI